MSFEISKKQYEELEKKKLKISHDKIMNKIECYDIYKTNNAEYISKEQKIEYYQNLLELIKKEKRI